MSIVGLCGRTVVRNAVQPDTPPITILFTRTTGEKQISNAFGLGSFNPLFYKKRKKIEIRRKVIFFFFFVTQRFSEI